MSRFSSLRQTLNSFRSVRTTAYITLFHTRIWCTSLLARHMIMRFFLLKTWWVFYILIACTASIAFTVNSKINLIFDYTHCLRDTRMCLSITIVRFSVCQPYRSHPARDRLASIKIEKIIPLFPVKSPPKHQKICKYLRTCQARVRDNRSPKNWLSGCTR